MRVESVGERRYYPLMGFEVFLFFFAIGAGIAILLTLAAAAVLIFGGAAIPAVYLIADVSRAIAAGLRRLATVSFPSWPAWRGAAFRVAGLPRAAGRTLVNQVRGAVSRLRADTAYRRQHGTRALFRRIWQDYLEDLRRIRAETRQRRG